MARVTIENCLKKVDGHFDLVLLAGERAKQISAGRKSGINKKGVKTHVTSLREIEEDAVSISVLRENIHDRINNIGNNKEDIYEESDDLIEELQSSEFITGELEEISNVEEFLSGSESSDESTEIDEEIEIDFGDNLDNE